MPQQKYTAVYSPDGDLIALFHNDNDINEVPSHDDALQGYRMGYTSEFCTVIEYVGFENIREHIT